MGLREDILKELVLEYQQTQNPVLFERILKRVDKLLLRTIHSVVRNKPYLAKIELRDLYHTSIIGLSRAIKTTKLDEESKKVVARVVAYVKATIYVEFPLNSFNQFFNFVELPEDGASYGIGVKEKKAEEDVYLGAELGLLRSVYKDMVMEGLLSDKDLLLLYKRFVEGKFYEDIGKEVGCSFEKVRMDIKKILLCIHDWIEAGVKKNEKII